jgi:hypothetical protein
MPRLYGTRRRKSQLLGWLFLTTLLTWRHVVKPDKINVFAFAVFRDFKQIEHAEEAGFACQGWRDIGKADRRDGVDFDLTVLHWIPPAHFDMGTNPDSDAACDFSAANSLAQALCKDHRRTVYISSGRASYRLAPLEACFDST